MEKKMLDIFHKLYSEIQDMREEMLTKDDIANMATKDDIANMATKDDIADMATKTDLEKLVTQDTFAKEMDNIHKRFLSLENKMDKHQGVLFDGYKLTYEKVSHLEDKLDNLAENLKKQDVEIRVIKDTN